MTTDHIENSFDTVYKNAFPAYKVFVFGKDISHDVLSVRVNQAGGSIERTPSTCSITLANKAEKYTITHEDMFWIGSSRSGTLNASYSEVLRSYSSINNEYMNPYLNKVISVSGNPLDSMKFSNLDPQTARELSLKLSLATDEEKVYILQAFGFGSTGNGDLFNLTESDAKSIEAQLKEGISATNSVTDRGVSTDEESESFVPFNIKKDVISAKALQKKEYEISNPSDGNNNVILYLGQAGKGTVYDYPFQEGDCIFHVNDPIRVAFRDPFDPRIWYWMFAGFMDQWTEDVGPELDSTITIQCTDITKSIRYAVTSVNPGLADPEFVNIMKLFDTNSEKKDWVLTKETFARLTISEIMELVFFGSISFEQAVNARMSIFSDIISKEIENIAEGELNSYLISRFGFTEEEVSSSFVSADKARQAFTFITADKVKQALDTEFQKYKADSLTIDNLVQTAKSLNWNGITSPRGVPFRRKDSTHGISFYVLGVASPYDTYSGAREVDTLYEWNEVIHHRVRHNDLVSLHKDQSYTLNRSIPSEDVVSIIGTDIVNYPVGFNAIYYFAPAGLEELTAKTGLVDSSAAAISDPLSVFKDRLSMFYDIADVVEWRFYATPKGDIVFEYPFYDFDPEDFMPRDQFKNTTDKSALVVDYEKTFGSLYSGAYTADDINNLSNIVFSLNYNEEELKNFENAITATVVDYADIFSIDIEDQLNFSNTNSDKGAITVCRAIPYPFEGFETDKYAAVNSKVYVVALDLIPTLGFRFMDTNFGVYVNKKETASYKAALTLNQINAEVRNLAVDTSPKFGIMVNRPIHWKYRNYYANIVSCTHSISWFSDAVTNINMNQIRGWTGEIKDGKPVYRHFGGDGRPFDFKKLIQNSSTTLKGSNG